MKKCLFLLQRESVQLILEIISALQYLYARSPSVLVRNLSPSVLVRKQDGGILLTHECDFACLGTQHTEKTALDIRNMDFLAPEQFVGITDIRSNIYNIGAILSYMLNGKTPKETQAKGNILLLLKCGFAVARYSKETDCLGLFKNAPNPIRINVIKLWKNWKIS